MAGADEQPEATGSRNARGTAGARGGDQGRTRSSSKKKSSLRGPRRDRDLLRAPLARGLASEPPERRPCPAERVRARPASFALEASRFPGCKRSICEAKERSREARSPSTPSVSRGSGQRHRARTQQLQAHAASPRGARATNIRFAPPCISRTCTRRNGAEKLSPARHVPGASPRVTRRSSEAELCRTAVQESSPNWRAFDWRAFGSAELEHAAARDGEKQSEKLRCHATRHVGGVLSDRRRSGLRE